MSILIKKVRLEDRIVDVLIQGSRIASIQPEITTPADQTIDGTDKAIFPSFINGHTHAAMTLLRGYADDLELYTWLNDHIWPFESRLTHNDIHIGARLACLEMIKGGTTFFCDMYWHMPATLQAVREMGLRAALSSVFIDFSDPARAKKFRSRTRKLFQQNPDEDRISFILGPHAIYTVSRESLVWIKDFARDNNLLINIHLSETRKEVQDCIQAHGLRPVEYLDSIGLLGPNLIASHAVWVNEAEMDLLAQAKVKVIHNPVSNMKLGSGIFPFSEMSRRKICIGLGTDGCSSNNNLSMLEEMKTAALMAKSGSVKGLSLPAPFLEQDLAGYLEQTMLDPTLFTASQALECATVNGAKIFGLETGSIQPGMLADCILVNLNHYSLVPGHDLVSNLVYSASDECVDTTICNGRVLMENRRVPGEEDIIREVREWEANLINQA
ncbi:MAG: amidohydrolase [Desulfonatronovibrionaceae bacterium]